MTDLVLPAIEVYAAACSLPETPVRRNLREETERTMEYARMLVGPLEGAFLSMMTRLVQAERGTGNWTVYGVQRPVLCGSPARPGPGGDVRGG
jgi:hypothetical protein